MENLASILHLNAPADPLLEQIRRSPGTRKILEHMRRAAPDLHAIPQTTYSLYRQFEHTGEREGYQQPYYIKRSLLSRVLEMSRAEHAVWSATRCGVFGEETLVPAHEEQGSEFWS